MDKVQLSSTLSIPNQRKGHRRPYFWDGRTFCLWFEVADRRKCQRPAAGVSQVKSLPHNVHGPAEALQPTAIGFGKMDKVELSSTLSLKRHSKVPPLSGGRVGDGF